MKKDEKRVADYKADKLPKDDFIFSEPQNKEEKDLIAAEKKKLEAR